MITSKEILCKTFSKAGKGYKADEVDQFVKEVGNSFETLEKSFEENEEKMLKLVEKINEYREDEDSIKDAILGAQKQGKQIVIDAELAADRMVSDAQKKSETILLEIKKEYSDELYKLENMKKEVNDFKSQLTELYNRQLHLIMEIPEYEVEEETETEAEVVEDETDSQEETIEELSDTAEAIEQTVDMISYSDLKAAAKQL